MPIKFSGTKERSVTVSQSSQPKDKADTNRTTRIRRKEELFTHLFALFRSVFHHSSHRWHDSPEDVDGPNALDNIQCLRVTCEEGAEKAHRVHVHLFGAVRDESCKFE